MNIPKYCLSYMRAGGSLTPLIHSSPLIGLAIEGCSIQIHLVYHISNVYRRYLHVKNYIHNSSRLFHVRRATVVAMVLTAAREAPGKIGSVLGTYLKLSMSVWLLDPQIG